MTAHRSLRKIYKYSSHPYSTLNPIFGRLFSSLHLSKQLETERNIYQSSREYEGDNQGDSERPPQSSAANHQYKSDKSTKMLNVIHSHEKRHVSKNILFNKEAEITDSPDTGGVMDSTNYKMDLNDSHVTPSYSHFIPTSENYITSVHEIYNTTAQAFSIAFQTWDQNNPANKLNGNLNQDDLLRYVASSLRFCKQRIESSSNLELLELQELSILLEYIIQKTENSPHVTLMVFKTILEFLPSRKFQFSDTFMTALLSTIAEKWTISTSYVLSMIMDAYLSRNKILSKEMYMFLITLMKKHPTDCSRSGHELLNIHGLLYHLEHVNNDASVMNEELLISAMDILKLLRDESVFQIFDEIALSKMERIGHQSFEKIIEVTIEYLRAREENRVFYLHKMMQYIHLMESRGFRIVDKDLLLQLVKLHDVLNQADVVHIFLRHASKLELMKVMKYISNSNNIDEKGFDSATDAMVLKYIKEELLSTESKLKETLLSKLRNPEQLKREKFSNTKKEVEIVRNQMIKNDKHFSSNQEQRRHQLHSQDKDNYKQPNQNSRVVLDGDQTIHALREGKFKRIYYDSNNIMYRGESRQFVVNRENQAVMSYMIRVAEKINEQYNIEQSHLVFDVHEEFEGSLPSNIYLWKARPVFKTADDMLVDMASKLPFTIRRSTLFVTADVQLQHRLLEKGVQVSTPTPFSHPETHVEKAPSAETTNLNRLMKL